MARGRMLNKKISADPKVNALPDDTARLLFTWMIAHLDQNGCLYGDPVLVKSTVFPYRHDVTIEAVGEYLEAMAEQGLIQFYTTDEQRFVRFPSFANNQVGLRADREAKTDIPLPPEDSLTGGQLRQSSGNLPDDFRLKRKEVEKKGNRKEEEGGSGGKHPDALPLLQKLPNWATSEDDAQWLEEFMVEYPHLTTKHILACRDYHSAKAKHHKGIWKTRLRNWMSHERQPRNIPKVRNNPLHDIEG